jgi:hypothetical protein
MKKVLSVIIAMTFLLALVPSVASAAFIEDPRDMGGDRVYKFNIIGVDNPKDADMDDNNGRRIFVDLYGESAIYLVQSGTEQASEIDPDDFAILDHNATDDDGALLAMPLPGLDPYNITNPDEHYDVYGDDGPNTMSDYSIYIRSLGKPGGAANITTCATLLDSYIADLLSGKFLRTLNRAGAFGGEASIEQVPQTVTARPKGKSDWYNVTAELTTIVFLVEVDINPDEAIEEIIYEYVRVPIFDEALQGEYWEYNNNGLKNLQVWIYDNSTDVSLGDDELPDLPTEPQP